MALQGPCTVRPVRGLEFKMRCGRSTTRWGGAAAASDWITGVKNRIVKYLQVMTYIEPKKKISLAQVANWEELLKKEKVHFKELNYNASWIVYTVERESIISSLGCHKLGEEKLEAGWWITTGGGGGKAIQHVCDEAGRMGKRWRWWGRLCWEQTGASLFTEAGGEADNSIVRREAWWSAACCLHRAIARWMHDYHL